MFIHRLCSILLVLPVMVNETCSADESPSAQQQESQRYTRRRIHDPDGIGKFYMGREIAHVMGFAGANWLERSSREREERLTLLVRSLRIKPGDVVADIGAGSGVISMLMAESVLPGGKVMAVDVQQEMLDRLQARCQKADIENIVPVLGTQNKSGLEPNSQSSDLRVHQSSSSSVSNHST